MHASVCIFPARVCDDPTIGAENVTTVGLQWYLDHKVEHTCNLGYTYLSGNSERWCKSYDGSLAWDSAPMVCQPGEKNSVI